MQKSKTFENLVRKSWIQFQILHQGSCEKICLKIKKKTYWAPVFRFIFIIYIYICYVYTAKVSREINIYVQAIYIVSCVCNIVCGLVYVYLCVCVCVSVCVYVCVCVCVSVCVYLCVCVCICVFVCVFKVCWTFGFLCVFVNVCVFVVSKDDCAVFIRCVSVCLCVYLCVCVYLKYAEPLGFWVCL